jgi:perosamine synthetase
MTQIEEEIEITEENFSQYVGSKYAVSVSNGTVALHLALLALGISASDEVLVPSLTYIASVNAISYVGAHPVFVDSLESTWQLNSDDLESRITQKTKAIMVVHLYGCACDMDKILSIAEKYNLLVIEDCAEAIGTFYKGKHVGLFGNISTFSFFGNKTLTTGEGGMVITNDLILSERAKHFKGQGLVTNQEYWHDVIGYNYRMTNICAAIGVAQLEKIEEILIKKRNVAEFHRKNLKGLPLYLHKEPAEIVHSYWMCTILLEDSNNRDLLRKHMSDRGVETRPTFYPVHTMPMYSRHSHTYPVAEKIARSGINLPSWPDLTQEQLTLIVSEIKNFFKFR